MQHARTKRVNGTSFRGTIKTTYNKLVETFGEPCIHNLPSMLDKVTIEWKLMFGDGTVATIYDWKNYGSQPAKDEEYEWHIGGFVPDAVALVRDAMGQQ